jgi:uncharacterized protein Yka (UPF0111/DUF47 family)
MKNGVLKSVAILLFAASISFSGFAYAEEEPNDVVGTEETKEMNCCEKMEMMKDQMKSMMENHQNIRNEMKNLFKELQQSGKLTQEQINKIKNMEKTMDQMGEKMKQMSSMQSDILK